jgi:carboxylesterase type B
MYNFDYAPADQIVHQVATKAGACHSCELPSVFNNQPYLHSPTEVKLAKSISSMWTAFGSTGNPSTPDLQWGLFVNGSAEPAAVLGPTPTVVIGLFKARCDLIDSLPYTNPN